MKYKLKVWCNAINCNCIDEESIFNTREEAEKEGKAIVGDEVPLEYSITEIEEESK